MQNSTSRKTISLIATIVLMTSLFLTVIPVFAPKPDPVPNIDWNEFQGPYDPAVHGVYTEWDPGSGNIPALALVFPGLPPGAVPDYTLEAKAYMGVRPNPVGVGQSVLVNLWVSPGTYHAFYGPDYKVTIEDPTGNQEVKVMDSYFADITAWFEFTPTMAGTWKLKFDFPGIYLPKAQYEDHPLGSGFYGAANNTYNLRASIYYTPDSTEWQELEVQEDYVIPWPPRDLPTDYWDRPINPMNREWWSIAGNWPFDGAWYWPNGAIMYRADSNEHKYVLAPETAHIVWKRRMESAGLLGGEDYYRTDDIGPGGPDIIYNGLCYQEIEKVFDGEVQNVWTCYDLRTGEIVWEQVLDTPQPTHILYERSTGEAVPGAEASRGTNVYLVVISGGTLYKYDPWDGELNLERDLPDGISSGTIWNNEYVLSVQNPPGPGDYFLINWTMAGSTSNFENRILNNITWLESSIGDAPDYENWLTVDGWWASPPGPQWCIGHEIDGYSFLTGEHLWHSETNDTQHENIQAAGQTLIAKDGIWVFGAHGEHFTGYSMTTGQKLWESTPLTDYPWGAWFPYGVSAYEPDETQAWIITATYEGVYAINFANGHVVWEYKNPRAVPFENPYYTEDNAPAAPFFTTGFVADDKVYMYNGEHSESQPANRDWSLHCIDAKTGEGIWTIYNPMRPRAAADGYLIADNDYDGTQYCFGQGKSAMTVAGPQAAVPLGTAVVIEGTVLDQSPAQPGTPCVSENTMNIQMEYLHLQQPIDSIWHNVTMEGVEVSLTAMDVDDPTNYVDLGTVTTNGYTGKFGMEWIPTEEGFYEIYASFGPTLAYGSSSASAFISVGPAPEETQTPEPSPEQPEQPIISLEAALIIAIVVIAAVIILAWALMRRK